MEYNVTIDKDKIAKNRPFFYNTFCALQYLLKIINETLMLIISEKCAKVYWKKN